MSKHLWKVATIAVIYIQLKVFKTVGRIDTDRYIDKRLFYISKYCSLDKHKHLLKMKCYKKQFG